MISTCLIIHMFFKIDSQSELSVETSFLDHIKLNQEQQKVKNVILSNKVYSCCVVLMKMI